MVLRHGGFKARGFAIGSFGCRPFRLRLQARAQMRAITAIGRIVPNGVEVSGFSLAPFGLVEKRVTKLVVCRRVGRLKAGGSKQWHFGILPSPLLCARQAEIEMVPAVSGVDADGFHEQIGRASC